MFIPCIAVWWNTEAILLALGQPAKSSELAGLFLKWCVIMGGGEGAAVEKKRECRAGTYF
jgi:hypothetical protein